MVAISRQRSCLISAAGNCKRSMPLNMILPPVTRPLRGRTCTMALSSVVLPQPDSPIKPRCCPLFYIERDAIHRLHSAFLRSVIDFEIANGEYGHRLVSYIRRRRGNKTSSYPRPMKKPAITVSMMHKPGGMIQ